MLTRDQEQAWLYENLTEKEAIQLLHEVYPAGQMQGYTISKWITSRTEDSNVPAILAPAAYPELTGQF